MVDYQTNQSTGIAISPATLLEWIKNPNFTFKGQSQKNMTLDTENCPHAPNLHT